MTTAPHNKQEQLDDDLNNLIVRSQEHFQLESQWPLSTLPPSRISKRISWSNPTMPRRSWQMRYVDTVHTISRFKRRHNPIDNNTLVSSIQSTYQPCPPWTRSVTCYYAPLRLKYIKTSDSHWWTAQASARQSHGGISVTARSKRCTRLHNQHWVNIMTPKPSG